MDRMIRAALIGCGAISEVHIKVILQMDNVRLVSVCDIDEALAKKTAATYHCDFTTDYQELLEDPNIDIVHILTPHDLHATMAIEAVERNKHVILEKPIGITRDSLQRLIEADEKSSAVIAVVFQNRYNPTTLAVKDAILTNRYGRLLGMKAVLTWHRGSAYYSSSSWRGSIAREGGGLLVNQAIHTLDLLRYLGGRVTGIKGSVANHQHPEIEVEDMAFATLYFDSGIQASFFGTNNYAVNSAVEMEFVFEKAILSQVDEELALKRDGIKEVLSTNSTVSGEKGYWGIGHQILIQEAYGSIFSNKQPAITVRDAAASNEIVLGIYESSRTGELYRMKHEG